MFEGLIICAGMRRSASTWQYQVARELAVKEGGVALDFVIWQELESKLRDHPARTVIVKTHTYYPWHTRCLDDRMNRIRVIYTYRDLRQVAASIMRMHSMWLMSTDILTEIRSIVKSSEAWCALPGVLIQPYEQILSKPVDCVIQIARMVQIDITRAGARRIAKRYNRSHQKQREPAALIDYDPQVMLWPNHISLEPYPRISDESKAAIESEFQIWMQERGYL